MSSQPGDYIGGGKNYLYNANDGPYTATAGGSVSGQVSDVSFSVQTTSGDWWNLEFNTTQLGTPLAPGTYTSAQRAAFATTGHPGLEISGDSRGSNTLTGQFTVLEAVFDYSGAQPKVVSFAATFEQHSEGGAPALTGTIYYNSFNHLAVADTSAPTTTAPLAGTTGKYGRYSSPVTVTLTATDPDGAGDVAATDFTLDGGQPQTYTAPFTISTDGLHTLTLSSADLTGNQETPHVQSIFIDSTGPPVNPPLSQLSMIGDPGDYIGEGQTYLYNSSDGAFTASCGASKSGGPVDSVRISFSTPNYSHWWYLNFDTHNLGVGLTPGEYDNAQRNPFEAIGHPGLDVSGDGRGNNTETGRFTILDAVFDYSSGTPQVVSFAATFEQHSEGGGPATRGSIYYQSTAYPTDFFLTSLSISPSGLSGGTPAVGTVTLSSPAGANGQVVPLSSSNTGAAAVPASVTVPAGLTTATFPVTTLPVTTGTGVTITGTGGGQTQTGTVNVFTAYPTKLTISPASVTGGQAAVGTLTLSGPAPTGGLSLPLKSGNTGAVTVPATALVPAGQTSVTFLVSTSAVVSDADVNILVDVHQGARPPSATLHVQSPASHLVPTAPASVTAGTPAALTITAQNASGETDTSYPGTVHFTSSDPAAALPGGYTFTSADQGTHTFSSVVLQTAGIQTITATDTVTGTITGTATISVSPMSVAGPPTLTSISPNIVPAYGPGFTMTVNGSGFVQGCYTLWNGSGSFQTTFLSATQLTVYFPPGMPAGTHKITVVNPGGAASNAASLVAALPLGLNSLSPSYVAVGSAAFSLTVSGTGFVNGATVDWNGTPLPTSYGSTTYLSATVPAADVSAFGTASVTVVNPDGTVSNGLALTVGPPTLLSYLTLNPSTVYVGQTSTGTIVLKGPAPAGGLTVSLSSPLPDISMPAQVTVPAGVTFATFTITALAGPNPQSGYGGPITASDGNATVSAPMTINPTSIIGLSVSPSSVTGGQSSTGTVTLSGPAPTGGIVVSLSSASTAATVPPSVTIPVGASSTTFPVTTSSVAAPVSVVISAMTSITRTATLTITPVVPVATTATLTSSLTPSVYGQSVTFTAAVTAASGVNAAIGSVQFIVDGTNVGSPITLDGTGGATYTTATLAVGMHSVTAAYSPAGAFTGSTSSVLTQTVLSTATATALVSAPSPSSVGQSVTFTATVTGGGGDPTGTVTFTLDGVAQPPVALTGGQAAFSTAGLSVGSHQMTASYGGDATDAASQSAVLIQTVARATTAAALASSLNPSPFGQSVTLTATVTGSSPTGTVIFLAGANALGIGTLNGGVVTFSTSALSAGTHQIIASYAGDGSNGPSTSAVIAQVVGPAATALAAANASGTTGQAVTLSATLTSVGSAVPGETVTFSVDGTSVGTATTNASGVATLSYTIPGTDAAGVHTLSIAFAGDANYGLASGTAALTVDPTALTAAGASGSAGQTLTLSAMLKKASGTALSGKTLTFSVDGTTVGTGVTNSSGTATRSYAVPVATALAVGSHTLTASFAGDAGDAAASGSGTLTVTKAPTIMTASSVSGTSGQTVTLSAVLKRTAGGAVVGGETVGFSVDGTSVGTAVTTSGGLAGLKYVIPAGETIGAHTLTVAFAGDGDFSASTASGTLTVSKSGVSLSVAASSGLPGQQLSLSATLKRNTGAALVGATLSFSVDGAAAGTATTNSSGAAALPYAVAGGAAAGGHAVSVTFGGDASDNAGAGKGTLTVRAATALSVSPVAGPHGTTVTLSATLTLSSGGAGLVGKSLTFLVDGKSIGTASTGTGGLATRTYAIPASATSGSHAVTASFAGDGGAGPASGVGTLTVN